MLENIRNQVFIEQNNRKMLRKTGMNGVAIVFFFCALMMIIPFDLEGGTKDLGVAWYFFLFFLMAVDTRNDSMSFTFYNMKKKNIFSLMALTPVDYKLLILGKIYIVWKELLILELIYQIPAFVIRLFYKGIFATPAAFACTIIVLLSGLIETTKIILAYTFRNKSDF